MQLKSDLLNKNTKISTLKWGQYVCSTQDDEDSIGSMDDAVGEDNSIR